MSFMSDAKAVPVEEEKVTYVVDVTVSRKQLNTLISKNAPETTEYTPGLLGGIATHLLGKLADGGMMIDKLCLDRIEFVAGPAPTGDDLARVVESAGSRDIGRLVVKWAIDPLNVGSLEEMAQQRGYTVQQLVQEGMDWVMDQGWLWNLTAAPFRVQFSSAQRLELSEIMGIENPCGEDVLVYMRKLAFAALDAATAPGDEKFDYAALQTLRQIPSPEANT